MATDLMNGLATTEESDIMPAVDSVVDWLSHEQQRQHKEVIAVWKLFRKQKSFWKPERFA